MRVVEGRGGGVRRDVERRGRGKIKRGGMLREVGGGTSGITKKNF